MAVPSEPQLLVARFDDLDAHAASLAAPARDLVAHDPLSDAVAAAVDLESASAYAKVAGARAWVGVDAAAAASELAARGESLADAPEGVFAGEEWVAAVLDDAVVEAAAPLANSPRVRRQYAPSVRAAARGDGRRLLDASPPAGRVVGALPASQYVDVAPALSAVNFRAEAFGVSVRGERSVLSRARLAASHVDPSKRNARLDAVDRWAGLLAPDGDVERVTVRTDGRLVRVTGVVDTDALSF